MSNYTLQRRALPWSSVAILFALASPVSAQRVETVTVFPAACGCFAGEPLGGTWTVYDFSESDEPLGTPAAPYNTVLAVNVLTIGTQLGDYIQGRDVSEIICGGGGDDVIFGGGGNDQISGGRGDDRIFGEENADEICGDGDDDELYGDDPTDSHGNLDQGDRIRGGMGDDLLFGGAANDNLTGGGDEDFADGAAGNDMCVAEMVINC